MMVAARSRAKSSPASRLLLAASALAVMALVLACVAVPSAASAQNEEPVSNSTTSSTQSTTTTTTTTSQSSPKVSLSHTSAGAGSVIGIVSGSGFEAGKNITVTFDGLELSLTGTCQTTSDGKLAGCSFIVPDEPSGSYKVYVSDGINEATVTFKIPVLAIPDSTFLVTGTSIGLGLVTQIVTRQVVDLDAERRMKAEVNAFNKEKREATLAKDKAKLEKLKKKELPMRQAQAKVSMARLKVTAITFIPLLAVYYLMASYLGGFSTPVAYSPIPIPYLVASDKTMVLFWWYMLSSFTFSSLLSRLLHTTP